MRASRLLVLVPTPDGSAAAAWVDIDAAAALLRQGEDEMLRRLKRDGASFWNGGSLLLRRVEGVK